MMSHTTARAGLVLAAVFSCLPTVSFAAHAHCGRSGDHLATGPVFGYENDHRRLRHHV